jgi:hypothetical protein
MQVTQHQGLFYADDGKVTSRNSEWLQQALDILTGLFLRVGFWTNTTKTKTMTCLPGHIRTLLSSAAYKRRLTGQGDSYRQRKCQKVDCPECSKELSMGSLQQHLQTQHGLDPPTYELPDNILDSHNLHTYTVSFPRILPRKPCPVPGCTAKPTTRQALHLHFQNRHPQDSIHILEEHPTPFPKCELCGFQVSLGSRNHQNTQMCKEGLKRKQQIDAAMQSHRAQAVSFQACNTPLDKVDTFKYLGRYFTSTDSDWPTLYKNLQKARAKWAIIAKVLVRDNATPRVSGMFYKAVVQAILLYGSESWVITPAMIKVLDSFHHRVARRITGRMPRRINGIWHYPPIAPTLEEAGLYTMKEYIERCRNTIAQYVATRPLHQLTQEASRKRGSPHNKVFWWEV